MKAWGIWSLESNYHTWTLVLPMGVVQRGLVAFLVASVYFRNSLSRDIAATDTFFSTSTSSKTSSDTGIYWYSVCVYYIALLTFCIYIISKSKIIIAAWHHFKHSHKPLSWLKSFSTGNKEPILSTCGTRYSDFPQQFNQSTVWICHNSFCLGHDPWGPHGIIFSLWDMQIPISGRSS